MVRLALVFGLLAGSASAQPMWMLQQEQNNIDARMISQNQEWYQLQRLQIERERLAIERERLRRERR